MQVPQTWLEGGLNGSTNSSIQLVAGSTVQGLVLVVGAVVAIATAGNCIMLSAVWRMPHLRTLTNVFTINLALTDLGVAVFVLPLWMASLAHEFEPEQASPYPYDLCQCIAFVTVMLLLVSVATLSGISIDRYLCICHPLQYPLQVTPRRVNIALTYIWLQSSVLASLPLWGWGEYKWRPLTVAICSPAWHLNVAYSSLVLVLGMLVPFSLMVFSYVRIVQEARRQSQRIQQIQLTLVIPRKDISPDSPPEGQAPTTMESVVQLQRRPSLMKRIAKRTSIVQSPIKSSYTVLTRNIKMLRIVFVVVGAFVVSWGPYAAVNIWSALKLHLSSSSIQSVRVSYMLDFAVTFLAFSSCAFNPFVFISLTRDFRTAVRMLMCHILKLVPCTSGWARSQTRRLSQANSMVESVRLHSRGSYDSGVDLDPHSPVRRPSNTSTITTTSRAEEELGPWCMTKAESAGTFSQHKFLGDDLPVCLEMTAFTMDANGAPQLPSPAEQITITVPSCRDYGTESRGQAV